MSSCTMTVEVPSLRKGAFALFALELGIVSFGMTSRPNFSNFLFDGRIFYKAYLSMEALGYTLPQ